MSRRGAKPPIADTQYGFMWGSLEVTRLASDPEGWVVLEVRTLKKTVQIYATKTGKMTITEVPNE